MSHQSSRPGIYLVCTNAQGLTPCKLLHHLSWCRERRVDISVLTETQTASPPEALLRQLPGAGAVWPGATFFSCPGTGHSEGIVIILGPRCPLSSTTLRPPPASTGRILRLDADLHGSPFSLVAVYAPTQAAERTAFYSDSLGPALPTDGRPFTLTGDFNCILAQEDAVYTPGILPPVPNSRLRGSDELADIMTLHNLRDVWRESNQGISDFSHWSVPASSGARLDRWLASAPLLLQFSVTASILPTSGFHSDHRPVDLLLRHAGPSLPKGKGLQGFPLLLLNIPDACQALRNIIATESLLLSLLPDSDLVTAWDNMKEVIRRRAWNLFREYRRSRLNAAQAADAEAIEAHILLRFATPENFSSLQRASTAKAAAATRAWQELGAKSFQALPLLEHMFGDTSSFYFHHLARSPHPPVIIRRLRPPGPMIPGDPPAGSADLSTRQGISTALSFARDFYSADSPHGLYRPRQDLNSDSQSELLSTLPSPLPPQYASLAEGLDGDGLLSKEELLRAISLSSRGSSPGYDGLPYEVYSAFRAELSPILLRVFNSAFLDRIDHSPLSPLLQGVICLLHKAGQPADHLVGYRPITLLNCDVKLILLVMSNRLQRPLDYIIHITQSAFLKGRDISDNVRYHLGLASRLKQLGLPGWLLHSDLTKAYDTADRGWLLKTMSAMGFASTGIVRWTSILMNGSTSRVRVNGFLTTAFPNSSGLPQGGALSCTQWVILFEPFLTYLNQLRSNGRLSSFCLPSGEQAPTVLSFADDSKTCLQDPALDGPIIKEAYLKATSAGLPAQSIAKTRLILLTLAPNTALPPDLNPELQIHLPTGYKLHPHESPHRLLGVPFGPAPATCTQAAFAHIARSMTAAAAGWIPRSLNSLGRSHVAMQCIASKMLFQTNFAAPPPDLLVDMQRSINRFVATSGRSEEVTPFPGALFPRFAIASLPVDRGGIAVPHLPSHASAMLAKTSWLLFRYSTHPWQQLYREEISRAIQHMPGQPPGYHALVHAPETVHLPSIPTQLARDSVKAFLNLRIHRIPLLDPPCLRSLLLEPTFNNSLSPDLPPIKLDTMSSHEASTWFRLQDVRVAFLSGQQLSPSAVSDLDSVIARLPLPWKTAVTLPDLPPSPWNLFSPLGDSGPILEGPDPSSGCVRLWELWPSGRLHPLPLPAPLPNSPPRSALIHLQLKPRDAWLRSDYDLHSAQQGLPAHQRQDILEPWFVGAWEDLQLDPRVWGLKVDGIDISLLDMTVRHARKFLFHDHRLSQPLGHLLSIPGYIEESAAWPRLWRIAPPVDPTAAHPAPPLPPDMLGIQGLEASWHAIAQARAQPAVPPANPEPADLPQHAWVNLQRDRPPRPGPADRAANRHVDAPIRFPLRAGFAQVWKRLDDKTLHRPFRITSWSLLHGTLGCRAFLSRVRGLSSQDPDICPAACRAPACLENHRLETLSHAFMDCPLSSPVIDWLLSTWLQLSGIQLPRSPDLLLADDLAHWPGDVPPTSTIRLWTFLRVTTLGALWQLRTSQGPCPLQDSSLPRQIIRLAIQHVHDAIARDWLRTQQDLRSLDDGAFCHDWWRGLDCSISVTAFATLWATPPFFCNLVGEPPRNLEQDTRSMEILFPRELPHGDIQPAAHPQDPPPPNSPGPMDAPPVDPAPPVPAPPPPPHSQQAVQPSPEPPASPSASPPSCPICYRSYSLDQPETRTLCGHVFHRHCLARWTTFHQTCPSCRRPLLPM